VEIAKQKVEIQDAQMQKRDRVVEAAEKRAKLAAEERQRQDEEAAATKIQSLRKGQKARAEVKARAKAKASAAPSLETSISEDLDLLLPGLSSQTC